MPFFNWPVELSRCCLKQISSQHSARITYNSIQFFLKWNSNKRKQDNIVPIVFFFLAGSPISMWLLVTWNTAILRVTRVHLIELKWPVITHHKLFHYHFKITLSAGRKSGRQFRAVLIEANTSTILHHKLSFVTECALSSQCSVKLLLVRTGVPVQVDHPPHGSDRYIMRATLKERFGF